MGVNTFAFVAAANKKAVEEKLLPDLSENCMLKISTILILNQKFGAEF